MKEPSNELAEDDARLGLVVRDVAGVLDELGHVDLVEREARILGMNYRTPGVSNRAKRSTYSTGYG